MQQTQVEPRKITINYCPHITQELVHKDESRFRVIVCGRRWGKTTLAINEIIINSFKPKSNIFFIAPTYRQAKMIAFEMLKEYLPKEVIKKIDEVDLEFILRNGSKISLKGAENEDSLRGVGLDFVVLDEFAQMKANIWQEIIRPMLSDKKGRALFIGTPKGKNALFDLYLKGQRLEDGYKSYRFKTIDNPHIDPLEIEDARKQTNDTYFKQEYEASFEDYTGLIYPEFNDKIHIIEPTYIPSHYKHISAIDPAISGTTASLFGAINEDGDLILYKEYYQKNVRVSEVCQELRNDKVKFYIDPASKSNNIQKEGKLYSLYNEFVDNGIVPNIAENDVEAGINRVAEYFKQGKLKIFSTLKNLVWELERYHWSEEKETTNGVMSAKPYKKDDHLCDCLRYLVMSRYQPSKEREQLVKRNTVAWEMLEMEREAKDWRNKYASK